MKRNDFMRLAACALLSGAVTFLALGCFITGFDLPIGSWWQLALTLILLAGLYTFAPQWRFGSTAFFAGFILLCIHCRQPLLLSLEQLLYTVSAAYDRVFECGVIYWSETVPENVSCLPVLTVLALFLLMPVIWALRYRGWIGFILIPGIVPLLFCSVVNATMPDSLFLMLLMALLLILTVTQLTRRKNKAQASRLGLLLLIPALLFSSLATRSARIAHKDEAKQIIEYFNQLFQQEDSPTDGPGIGNSVSPAAQLDLSAIGPDQPSDREVLSVTATRSGLIYLRGQSYDKYTGTSWFTDRSAQDPGGWPVSGMQPYGSVSVTTAEKQTLRYTPYYVANNNWEAELTGGAYDNPNRRTTYRFARMIPDANQRPQLSPLSEIGRIAALALPSDTRTAALRILQTIPKNGDDAQAIAEAIAAYVQSSADYDLRTPAMPEDTQDFAIWFLEESTSGYCVHFASAATVLLRAAGIPARFVSGYIAYTLTDVAVPVTERQAHAWAEYLHPVYGWTVLEATPGEEYLPEVPTAPSVETTETTAPTQTQSAPVFSPSQTTQPPTLPSLIAPKPTQPQKPDITEQSWFKALLWTLLTGAGLLLQYGLRLHLRQKWLNRGVKKKQLLRRWRYARAMAWITRQKLPVQLYLLAEKAAFSQYPPTREELTCFDSWLADNRNKLLAKPLPLRLLLQLLLAI